MSETVRHAAEIPTRKDAAAAAAQRPMVEEAKVSLGQFKSKRCVHM